MSIYLAFYLTISASDFVTANSLVITCSFSSNSLFCARNNCVSTSFCSIYSSTLAVIASLIRSPCFSRMSPGSCIPIWSSKCCCNSAVCSFNFKFSFVKVETSRSSWVVRSTCYEPSTCSPDEALAEGAPRSEPRPKSPEFPKALMRILACAALLSRYRS